MKMLGKSVQLVSGDAMRCVKGGVTMSNDFVVQFFSLLT